MGPKVRDHRRLLQLLLAVLAVACFLWFPHLAAQTSQAPIFKSKVDVVQLDVTVLDKHRKPVRGLTEKDFTILEDGKPQPIVGFATFDIDTAEAPATGWMRDVASDVATNQYKESRLFVIVMDDALIPQDPFAIQSSKQIALSIIDKLGPDDLTAVVFTGDNRKTQDFTSDKNKLRAALDKFNPGLAGYLFGYMAPTHAPGISRGGRSIPPPANPGPIVDTDLWFYQSSVRTISNIADFLSAVQGRRKAVFLVSPGVPLDLDPVLPRNDDDIMLDTTEEARMPNPWVLKRAKLPPETMVELSHRLDEVFRRAQRANVTFYPIDPTGLGGMDAYLKLRLGQWNLGFSEHKASAQQDYLAAAAANTGGRTVMNTNEFDTGIREVFEENESYYLIGFEPLNVAADGRLRRLEVKVNRPDVEVRTRSSYYAPEPPKTDQKVDKNPPSPETVALNKAMSGILPMAGMPMRASVAPFAVPGQRLSTVAIVLGITQPIPATAANGRITETTDLLTSAFTPEGDARGAQKHTARVVLRAGSNGDASYEVLARIDLPPGRYSLRLAAHNGTSGRDGSVYADVTVPDYSNLLFSSSPIVLGATPGRVSAPKDLFTPLLPFVPTAEREFARTDKVTSLLRLYQGGQKPIEAVKLTIRLRDSSDQLKADETQTLGVDRFPAAGQQVAPLASSTPTARPGGMAPVVTPQPNATGDQFANYSLRTADVKYQLPIEKLAAGQYLLTMEATLGATTIRRDVRFSVR